MSYRSIKRVIGETSLERKCRFLFVACLSVVLFVTFWWVEHIAEDLVEGLAQRQGRDLVDSHLLRFHWGEVWETDLKKKEFAQEMARDLLTQEYESVVLALDPADGELPADAVEEEILQDLQKRLQEQMQSEAFRAEVLRESAGDVVLAPATGGKPGEDTPVVTPPSDASLATGIQPVYHFQPVPSEQEIHYYQPVYWKASCFRCHEGLEGVDAFSQADALMLSDEWRLPFRVVKVTIPDRETQNAITTNRALLTAIGILTVFLAMVILYVIIRYVVVKPLQHLRDVSEAISRGDTELRAEIKTNDEFEELASAFNRMLRHLLEAQSELRHVNTDLDAKVDQLAQLNMRLYEMNRLKSDFLANMSHELRTPLNSIIGFSEILSGIDSLTDKQKRYAHNIQKSGRLLLDLINDILDLAKIEAGKMDVRLTEFQIGPVIQAQCEMVRSLSEDKNIDLEVRVPQDAPPLFQDQSKIQQVVINLLSNAIKFTPEGGRIVVTATPVDDRKLQISVADTGVGIPEEDREIIFEKFRQSSAAVGEGNLTREYSGTGLGLSIVKELCKLLGGEISFESELGKGSEFFVTIPWVLERQRVSTSHLETQLDEIVHTQDAALAKSLRPAATP
jgi:two-component system sensor histidine kinase BarA